MSQKSTYPFPVQKITLQSGDELAYIKAGNSDTVILMLHGMGSYSPAWAKMMKILSTNYTCIAVDLPGYGHSGNKNSEGSMDFFASVIDELIQKLNLQNIIIAGHSMGAHVAMHRAIHTPGNEFALILLAPAGFETFTEADRKWFSTYVTPPFLKLQTDEQIRNNFHANFTSFPEDAAFMISDRMILKNSPAFDNYCQLITNCVQGMLKSPVFDQLNQIKVPTLVLFGADDKLIPNRILHPTLTTKEVAQSGHSKIPKSQLYIIPGTGHMLNWEGDAQASEHVMTFIRNMK
ncbi:MAG: alpha/beta hydrolase [Saprospiraceae bacterium]|nr:alpha/beta hydrolase [Saprospiraceae bacterium]